MKLTLRQDLELEELQEAAIQYGIYDRLIEEKLESKPHQLMCAICQVEFIWYKISDITMPLCNCD